MKFSFIFFTLLGLATAFSPLDNAVLCFPSPDSVYPIYDTIGVGILLNTSTQVVEQSALISVLLPNGTLQFGELQYVGCGGYSDGQQDVQFMIFLQGTYTLFWNVTYNISSDPSQANSTSCGPGPYSAQIWLLNSTFTASYETTSIAANLFATMTFCSEPTGSVPWDQVVAAEAVLLSDIRLSRFTQFSATALVVYDVFITLGEEIELVWRGTWGLPAFIYLTNRYGVLVQTLGLLAIVLADEITGNLNGVGMRIYAGFNAETHLALAFNFWLSLSVPIIILMIEAIITIRVIALHENSRRIAVSLWSLYICTGATTLTVMGIELSQITPSTQEIDLWVTPGDGFISPTFLDANLLFAAAWVPGLVMEMVLMILTIVRGVRNRRNGVMTPLLTILIRDGVVYFVVVFVLMLSNFIIALYSWFVENSARTIELKVELTLCVASVLCSRFFLNLRSVAYGKQIQTRQMSPDEYLDLYPFGGGYENLAPVNPSLMGTTGGYSEDYR